MVEQPANSGDLDQTLHSVSSDLGLHCLPVTHLGVSVFNDIYKTNQFDAQRRIAIEELPWNYQQKNYWS